MKEVVWYVLCHPETEAPILIHWDKKELEDRYRASRYKIVSVKPCNGAWIPEYLKPNPKYLEDQHGNSSSN